jgi:hypothetical protein
VIEQMAEAGAWVIGTPDDLIAAIERLQERSGGFGGLLVVGHEWAPPEATARSWELLARDVAPRFQGSLMGIQASNAVARARAARTGEERVAAVEAAQRDYEAGRARS